MALRKCDTCFNMCGEYSMSVPFINRLSGIRAGQHRIHPMYAALQPLHYYTRTIRNCILQCCTVLHTHQNSRHELCYYKRSNQARREEQAHELVTT